MAEHPFQSYLKEHGPSHLRQASRGLRLLTSMVRKLDETAGIVGTIPRQLGFVSGLQEIYARRVGLTGRLPQELCHLSQLRVLSMGNNKLCGALPEGLGRLWRLYVCLSFVSDVVVSLVPIPIFPTHKNIYIFLYIY